MLPHLARVLDAGAPANEFEVVIDVELLAIDATSYRTIRERAEGDGERMASLIAEIVAERGKLQNPWTGSGGVLMGSVATVGERYDVSNVQPGDLVVPVASLIAVPLTLHSVGPLDPDSALVPARGRAIVTGRMPIAILPDDLPREVSIAAFDVYPAASYARALAHAGGHVLVLGAGHAGLVAIAAAREAVGGAGHVSAVDVAADALARARTVDPALIAVQADVADPLAVASSLEEAGLPRADLTLLCTTVGGAEGTAILATSERGRVVFFSTATSFAGAALGVDPIGSRAQLIIPNGQTDDMGAYTLQLLRTNTALLDAFRSAR